MNKLLSKVIDYYALSKLHKKRSKAPQFSHLLKEPLKVLDIYRYYPVPDVPRISFIKSIQENGYETGSFSYQSEIDSGNATNDIVTGRYCINENKNKSISIILVHGWRASNYSRIEKMFLADLKKHGYNIYLFALPYHLSRTPEHSLYSGEYMISANIDRTFMAIKQAVTDLRALIHHIKAKEEKVIVIGISLGGLITNLTGVVEKQIDRLVSIFYANNLAYSVWQTIPGKYIKKELKDNDVTYEKLNDYWAVTVPSNFSPIIPKENILLLSAKYDQYMGAEDTKLLWKKWGKPALISYPCGHAGIVLNRGQIVEDTISFISRTSN
nr:alpha/beta hydrolase [Desulfuribacillus alkaliarsenatis]